MEQVTILQEKGQEYYDLAESHDFDYEAMMKESGDEVQALMADSQEAFEAANPAYEEMEGVVAGVPRLAQYDVDIDAGSDASDPESAVSFSLELPDGETLEQPGNLFFVTETSLYGTNPDFLADVPQDVDGDGKEEDRRGHPGREHLPRRRQRVPHPGGVARRGRSGVRGHRVRRVHRDHGDDPDHGRVLRGLEELGVHRRRGRLGAWIRRDVAPF